MKQTNLYKPSPTDKYRPTLTELQMHTIVALASNPPISPDMMSLIATLAPTITKIQVGSIKAVGRTTSTIPAKTPFQLLEEIGGLEANDPNTPSAPNTSTSAFCKSKYWSDCHIKWLATPELCNATELQAVAEHRYLNDLMTPEEMLEHEAK